VNAQEIANFVFDLENRAEKAEALVERLSLRSDTVTKTEAVALIVKAGSGRLATNDAMAVVRVDELSEVIAAVVDAAFQEGRHCTCAVRLGASRPHANSCEVST
jgi:hypothetical protein